MKRKHSGWLTKVLPAVLLAVFGACSRPGADQPQAAVSPVSPPSPRAALTVQAVRPLPVTWEKTITATGTINAWQETVVSSETGGLRIAEVLANVGDSVKKGQTLALLDSATVQADLAEARARLQEARALHAEARANADRARRFQPTGMMSQQQVAQYLTAEQTAGSRIDVAAARLQIAELKVRQTHILAPDDALVSARAATPGTVPQSGQELFRLILRGRLEWRAEVPAEAIGQVRPGDGATVTHAGGETLSGKVRSIAPSIDPQTRNGIVYIDVTGNGAKAGMFASGKIMPAAAPASLALSLPQSALLLRDGFSWVFRIGQDRVVAQTRVVPGRRQGDRVEILSGIAAGDRFVESGVGFLNDGDLVDIIDAAP